MAASRKKTLKFKTEVSQLLQLMIHSLYSNKEIFLRELISNASDACDKLRFQALSKKSLLKDDTELRIEVDFDSEAKTITVRDNGIGMTEEDLKNNIGTIAKSGTAEFLSSLSGDKAKDANLIGQFGVGFYSSFIIAEKVEIFTRHAGAKKGQGIRWESAGEDSFSINEIDYDRRGTEVVLHLRDGEDEFLNDWRLRSIVNKYSDHITLPIRMLQQATAEEGEEAPEPSWETINSATALWTKPKRNVKKDQYIDFYKHVSGDFEEPLSWTHNHVEGKQQYISLLYIPTKAPFDLNEPVQRQGIKLYIQRVFVMEDTEKLMPRYLRFVRGLVDSSDLPLNVSREILQENRLIQSIRAASVKKVLGLLEQMAKKDADKFETFWKTFGPTLKEGPVEDFANREQILKLLRFASSHDDVQDEKITLDDYIGRMQPGQEKIFYITADSFSAAKNSPHLEIFRKKGIEVLLMSDRVDEWVMGQVTEYDGKQFQSVAKGDLDLDDIATKKGKKEKKAKLDEGLLASIKTNLEDKVEEVKVSERLTTSPSCIVLNEQDMALYMQQLMQQAGQDIPVSKPVLEVNPGHDILKKMGAEKDTDALSEWSQLLLDQAILCEGGRLEDPAGAVARMNRLMLS